MADRNEPLRLGGDRERLPISLAVLEQPSLVGLHELEGDGICLLDTMLLAEAGEVSEIPTPADDRRVGVVVHTHPEQILGDIGLERCHGRDSFLGITESSSPSRACSGLSYVREPHFPLRPFRLRKWPGNSVRRYYDPGTGQFLSVDPAVDQTEQPYAYVNGDPVDSVDPLGLGVGDLFNPWSPHNPIREWAASGSLSSKLLYLNPAYPAVIGYGAEAQAWENGCSLWTVAGYGAAGTVGLATIALWFPTSAALPAAEVTTVTIGPKVAAQMEARGWTEEAIQEAMSSGKQIRAVNKATGNPATRYINPTTGQSVVVDDVTGEVIHVGGPGFKYGPGSGDVP